MAAVGTKERRKNVINIRGLIEGKRFTNIAREILFFWFCFEFIKEKEEQTLFLNITFFFLALFKIHLTAQSVFYS